MSCSRRKLYWERTIHLFNKGLMAFMPAAKRNAYLAQNRQQAFQTIAREQRWGQQNFSGGGSTIDYTQTTRRIIRTVVDNFDIQSMVDVACGDFGWMPIVLEKLPAGFVYRGADIVPELIERHAQKYPQHSFDVLDFVDDPLPPGELIFCRDVLQHLPIADIKRALVNFSTSDAKYLLATTHIRRMGWKNGRDRRVGQCQDRNLLLKPFNLADPIAIYSEQDPGHKYLGLWELPLRDVDGRLIS